MKNLFRYVLASFLCLSGWILHAQNIPEPMSPPRLVNDFAAIFSKTENQELEQILRDYNDSTSTQIYIVTVNDLEGYAASDYAFQLGEKWKIGQKTKDNGAVILIKPKRGNSRGDVFIAVGYGLEEKLNDARIGRIIDNYMIPYFRVDDYYSASKGAIEAMTAYLSGQFQADGSDDNQIDTKELILTIIIIFIIFYFLNKNGGSGGGGRYYRTGGSSRGFGGSFGGSRGFGGGGGGSFGGGGAGRSW